MSRKLKQLVTVSAAVLLTSCSTNTISGRSAPVILKAVPCPQLPGIGYHAPTTESDVANWQAGRLVDTSNKLDTPATVEAIRKFNAARDAVCGP